MRILIVCLLALATTASATPQLEQAYSFVVYFPKLMEAPFAFRGEGHTDARQCDRIRTIAVQKIAEMWGRQFNGTVSPCALSVATIVFPE